MPKWEVYDEHDHFTGEVLDGWRALLRFLFIPRADTHLYIYPFREWVREYRRRKLREADRRTDDRDPTV